MLNYILACVAMFMAFGLFAWGVFAKNDGEAVEHRLHGYRPD